TTFSAKRANTGWNLGNSRDAIPNEADWGNAPVTENTFDNAKAAGYKSIRLPVTWTYRTGPAPDYTIDLSWLRRVSDVIDMSLSRDLYTIINVHHDSWQWADITVANANLTLIEDRFRKIWAQIASAYACESSLLAFEPINEPPTTTAEHGAEINKLNQIFLDTISSSGGFNAQRVVTLCGGGMDSIKTSQWFKRPSNITNPWALQYHYYAPYDFILSAWGKTIWGSDADKQALEADLANIRNNFTDVSLVIGEWAASPVATESAARWKYIDFSVRTARKYGTATMLWDNGQDFLDRTQSRWRDSTAQSILSVAMSSTNTSNALPDSAEDLQSPTQSSSAYILHRMGTPAEDAMPSFQLNGNKVRGVRLGSADALTAANLTPGTHYTVSGPNVTIKAAWTRSYLSANSSAGIKTLLTRPACPR
ncbi:hypothetical protein LTS18_008629, partial [Coniosporium uncinatum]